MVHSDTCKLFLTWADIAVIAWYGVVGQLLIKQLPPFSESFSSSGKLELFNKAVRRIKWYPEHHLITMWPNDTEIVWGGVDTWWRHGKVRTQDHMRWCGYTMVSVRRSEHRTQHIRWCGCMHDGISEKFRTQDHMRWCEYMMVLVRRSEHRTQHRRWCRCMLDDINKKVR